MKPEIKPTGVEGLYQVKDDGPVGPHHRKATKIIEGVLNVVAHVELECGHTMVIFNPTDFLERRGGLVFCGECAELPEAKAKTDAR